jgi:hypothetical protein
MGVFARLLVPIVCAPAAACLALAAGCGSSNHHAADASADSATDDADSLDAGDADDTPEEPAFTPAAHRAWPQLQRNSGRTLSPMTLVTIVTADDTLAPGLFAFSDAIIASSWWKETGAEYGVGPAAKSIHVSGPAITASMTTAEVIQYIADTTVGDAGAPAPNGNTLYLLYLPSGAGVTDVPADFTGFHNPYTGDDGGGGDAYAVVTRSAPGYGESQLDELTLTASHEIMEAATDPGADSWKLAAQPPYPWQGSVWSSFQQNGIECGDLCEGTRIREPLDGGAEYQRIWSNAAALDGGDPCVPPIARPFENVSVPKDWYKVAAGQKVAIPMTGWSAAPTGDWLVSAYNGYSTAAFAKVDYGAGVVIGTDLGLGTKKSCYPFQAMNNGTNGTITVTAPAAAGTGDFIVVIIESFRENSGNCITPADDDYDHEWPVGVYVP